MSNSQEPYKEVVKVLPLAVRTVIEEQVRKEWIKLRLEQNE